MSDEQKKFQQIVDVSLEFNQAKDIDLLLEKILSAAQKLANAEAGSIYHEEGDVLRHHHNQNETLQNHLAPGEKLLYASSLPPVDSGSIASYVAETGSIVNIPDVQSLPDDAPYTFQPPQGEGTHYGAKSVLAFPLKNAKRQVIGVIELINPHNEGREHLPITEDDLPLIRLFATNATNAIERARTTRTWIMSILQVLTTLRNTEETLGHFNRVGAYSAEIYEIWARKKGIPPETISVQKDLLRTAAMLHDIGKLAIPNIIRAKPGKLTAEEYETIKQHTVKGAQLLRQHAQSELENIAAEIALNHHEHWDGSGYPGHIDPETGQALAGHEDDTGKPRGKRGEEIPVFGRIVAIADVYDSLLSHRVYRAAWKEEDVLKALKKGAGTRFDPEMIQAFLENRDMFRAIAKRYLV